MNTIKYNSHFICPRCKQNLSYIDNEDISRGAGAALACANDHSYTIDDGIPILLTAEDSLHSFVKEAFTDLACNYEKTIDREIRRYWGVRYEEFVRVICEMVKKEKPRSLLDIATGTGKIPRTIETNGKTGIRMCGIDITFPVLRAARARSEESHQDSSCELVCASAMNIPYPDETFDLVTCVLAGHHLDAKLFVSEARRVLARNGKLIIADVVASDFFRNPIGRAVLSVLLLGYVLVNKRARAKAEKEALRTIRTGPEWKDLLVNTDFSGISEECIKPRKPYYPGGIIISGIRA
jgi:ubiquinone/menaquinone biosynthesis C-methylase UbiE